MYQFQADRLELESWLAGYSWYGHSIPINRTYIINNIPIINLYMNHMFQPLQLIIQQLFGDAVVIHLVKIFQTFWPTLAILSSTPVVFCSCSALFYVLGEYTLPRA